MSPKPIRARIEEARQLDYVTVEQLTDEEIEREYEAIWAKRQDLDAPAYPHRGVYFLACADFIKIGIANSVPTRIAELTRIIPVSVQPLGWLPYGGERNALELIEEHLHAQFASLRTKGEWFRADAALLAFIHPLATVWAP